MTLHTVPSRSPSAFPFSSPAAVPPSLRAVLVWEAAEFAPSIPALHSAGLLSSPCPVLRSHTAHGEENPGIARGRVKEDNMCYMPAGLYWCVRSHFLQGLGEMPVLISILNLATLYSQTGAKSMISALTIFCKPLLAGNPLKCSVKEAERTKL